MTAEYARPDLEVVDYQIYCLDPGVIDRQTNAALMLRGPALEQPETGKYFVCIGGAQTFGRFCQEPFPSLLQKRLGMPVLNLGRGGAGPSFFSKENKRLLSYVNRASFAIIQITSGRSASSSLFTSKGLGFYTRKSDRKGIGCDDAFRELLETDDEDYARKIVAETRQNWVSDYQDLLGQIKIPRILLWFSVRKPHYTESYRDVYALFGEFPQLVNLEMVNQLRRHSDEYVECVSTRGLPQLLVSRFTGDPVTVSDPWGGTWTENWYYPSPEMHVDAAIALEPVCRRLLNQDARRRFRGVSFPLQRKLGGLQSRKGDYTEKLQELGKRYRFRAKRAALGLGLSGGHGDYVRFIVLGTARTGSTLLLGLLNSHSQVIAFGELFRSSDAIGWDLPGYDRYLQSSRLIALKQQNPSQFLEEEVFGKYPRQISAVGFKIFYYHAQGDRETAIWELLREQEELRIIHLKRDNLLRLLLSLKKAHLTDRWVNIDGSQEERLAIPLDYHECLETFTRTLDMQEEFDVHFKDQEKIEVVYEDLAADYTSEMKHVQDFLGLDYEAVKPSTRKQATQSLSDAISNYSELKRRFRNTPWERFFED